MALSRISITIPEDLIGAADRRAAELDRSRSWVLVEALRRYLATGVEEVREPEIQYVAGLDPSRSAQLAADLRLTPEERVLSAERTLLVDAVRGRSPGLDRLLTFDSYEAYLEWQRREDARPW
jgi:hypothetical protein